MVEGRWTEFSYANYEFFRKHDESFQELCAFESNRHRLRIRVLDGSDGRDFRFARGKVVSGNYFSVLGVKPAVGRLLAPADDQLGAPGMAVMSYAYWHSQYNEDRSVVGRVLEVNGAPFTIVGVAAKGFSGESAYSEDLWFPLASYATVALHEPVLQDKSTYWLNLMGRLRPGVSIRQASAAANVELRELLQAEAGPQPSDRYQRAMAGSYIGLVPGARGISLLRSQYSQALEILMAVAGLVLLIACANVANLLLSRGSARTREISVRLALGASRGRLVRQLFTEGLLLAGLGGLAGLVAAKWGAQALFTTVMGAGSTVNVFGSGSVLLFLLSVSTLSAILFGIAPAIGASRAELSASMKGIGAAKAISRGWLGGANTLVVFQVAMALPLLIGAGLFVRTLEKLMAQQLGFSEGRVLVARVDPQIAGYAAEELPLFYESLREGMSSLPGVTSVTFDSTTPMGGGESTVNISIEGRGTKDSSGATETSGEETAHVVEVGERYFETIGTPILLGRDISAEDIQEKRQVAVINQTMARRYFGGKSPIGRRYCHGSPFDPRKAVEIVGVAADARYYSLRDDIPPMVFNATAEFRRGGYLVLRGAGNTTAIITEASKRATELAPRLPPLRVFPLRDQVQDQLRQERTVVDFSSAFGALALLLACVGLYGTMAYRVSLRTGEIGVRMALGAQRVNVMWLVMRESALLLVVGLPIGVLLALGSTRFVRSQLFGLSASDPLTIASAAGALAVIAMIAAYLPARRAMNVDPVVALRNE